MKKQFFSDVLDEWLDAVRPKLKPTTYAAYETILMRHIRPELHNYPPGELSDSAIERFWARKMEENLSPSTLRGTSCVLRAVTSYGKRYGCAVSVEACKIKASRKKTDIAVLSDDERRAIVSEIGAKPGGKALGVLILGSIKQLLVMLTPTITGLSPALSISSALAPSTDAATAPLTPTVMLPPMRSP